MTSPPRRPVVARVAAALLLLAAGELARRTAGADGRLADALERQATMARPAVDAFADMEQSLGIVGRLPLVGRALVRDIRYRQAEAAYWAGDYPALIARAENGEGGTDDTDPAMTFLTANAMFRAAQRQPAGQATVRALDEALRQYALVLQSDAGHLDAAYNYELVVRLRDAAARGRFTELRPREDAAAQGEAGSPPPNTRPSDFNVIVPLRPDERQDQFDAGAGTAPARKG
ncbi:MAG: hypothetical protein HY657_06400 [Acidobacteria bacterium]|nr:hypothetical protein [Acidobacteriota bacterium]